MMHEGWNDPRSPYYHQGYERDEGRDHMSLTQPNEDCGDCLWFHEEIDDVPYGKTTIVIGRRPVCELDYDCTHSCPPGTWQPKPRGRDLRAEHAGWLADLLEELER